MGVEVSRLSNGMTVATETLPHVETVALGIWVKSGARDERDDEHGVAHLLEHMAFKGTSGRSAWDIASQIENVGGEINAATSVETTSFYARVLRDDMPLDTVISCAFGSPYEGEIAPADVDAMGRRALDVREAVLRDRAVAVAGPRHADRPDRNEHQLSGRRPARRARSTKRQVAGGCWL